MLGAAVRIVTATLLLTAPAFVMLTETGLPGHDESRLLQAGAGAKDRPSC